jgi:hypothetical protein
MDVRTGCWALQCFRVLPSDPPLHLQRVCSDFLVQVVNSAQDRHRDKKTTAFVEIGSPPASGQIPPSGAGWTDDDAGQLAMVETCARAFRRACRQTGESSAIEDGVAKRRRRL